MRRDLLRSHDRPAPAAYVAAAVTTSVVVAVAFTTARWLPWYVEDAGLLVGPAGFVGQQGLVLLGTALAVPAVAACWVALRWPAFAIALALLPVASTVLDPKSAPMHFGVFATLGAVAVTSSWRRPRASVAATAVALVVLLGWLLSGRPMAAPFGAQIYLEYTDRSQVGTVYAVALLLVLGFALALRSTTTRELQRRRLAAREGAVADQAAVLAERARLARDLHDVVAHHVSLIAVRAETAPYTVPTLGDDARRILGDVAADARLALEELRGVLGILGRAGEAERSPQPTLADLPALVERNRRSGQDVRVEGDLLTDVGAASGYAAYRVVQEALTNARKHAPDAPVDVSVSTTGRMLEVRVRNPLAEPPEHLDGGRGLSGMRERVEALGGRLHVRAAGAVFELDAVLPSDSGHDD